MHLKKRIFYNLKLLQLLHKLGNGFKFKLHKVQSGFLHHLRSLRGHPPHLSHPGSRSLYGGVVNYGTYFAVPGATLKTGNVYGVPLTEWIISEGNPNIRPGY